MGIVGIFVLLLIAAIYGVAAHVLPGFGGRRTRFDGAIVFLVALLSGLIANLLRTGLGPKGIGPQVGGLYFVPVALVAAFWSVVVLLLLRKVGRKKQSQG
jgi:hypothetical protein